MVSTSQVAAFAVLAFVVVAIPGPSVLFTISRAMTVGRRDALLTVVANGAGVYAQIVAVAFGLGALVAQSAAVFSVVKLVGAGYLVYLGVQAWRHRRSLSGAFDVQGRAPQLRVLRVLRDGFVVGVTNPKTMVFLVAVLPQSVRPEAGAVPLQVMLLGTLIPLFGLLIDSGWAVAAGVARDWFARSPRRLSMVGGAGGLTMIGLGIGLAFTGRRD